MDRQIDRKIDGISAFQLKLLALITMALDHIGAVILEHSPYLTDFTLFASPGNSTVGKIDVLCRGIGRLAFPLFCFLLVEGFHYTKNRMKYAIRLLIFALVSEIPFDMAFNGKYLEWGYNNVGFTLLLGFLSIWILDMVEEKARRKYGDDRRIYAWFACAIVLVLLMDYVLEKNLVRSDYGVAGVLAILILYLMPGQKMFGYLFCVLWLGLTCGMLEFVALINLIPLYFYHGRQGRKMKYLFYIFYPAHLLILAGIGHGLGWIQW